MIWRDFNLNDAVRVKLTDVGLAEYRRRRMELNAFVRRRGGKGDFPTEPRLDEEGYYRTQMWDLMNTFGHLVGMGMPFPFEMPVQVEVSE